MVKNIKNLFGNHQFWKNTNKKFRSKRRTPVNILSKYNMVLMNLTVIRIHSMILPKVVFRHTGAKFVSLYAEYCALGVVHLIDVEERGKPCKRSEYKFLENFIWPEQEINQ